MPNLDILFTKGQSEAADPKVLPNGTFSSMVNMRYQKDARLCVRNGYRHDTNNTQFAESTVLAVGRFTDQHAVVMRQRGGDDAPPEWSRHIATRYDKPNGPPIDQASGGSNPVQQAGSIGVPTVIPAFDGSFAVFGEDIACCDSVVVGNYLYVAVTAYNNVSKAAVTEVQWAGFAVYLYKIDTATGTLVAATLIAVTGTNVKLVVANGLVCAVYAGAANAVLCRGFTATTLSGFAEVTLATAAAGRAPYFDIAPGLAAANFLLAYPDSTTTMSFGRVTVGASAAYVAETSMAGLTGPENRPAICASGLNPTRDIVLVIIDGATFTTGTAKWRVWNTNTPGFTGALTTFAFASSGTPAFVGYPVLAASALDDWTCAFNVSVSTLMSGLPVTVAGMAQATNSQSILFAPGLALASKPITISTTFITLLATDVGGTVPLPGGYYFIDNDTPPGVRGGIYAEAAFAAGRARPPDIGSVLVDPRRNIATAPAVGSEPGVAAIMAAIPMVRNQRGGWGLVRAEFGKYAEMFQSARLNSQLFFSGPRVLEYDGSVVLDAGISTPTIVSTSQTTGTGGAIAAGTYQFIAVLQWIDALGYVHQSPPSLPVTVVVAAPATTVTVLVTPPTATARDTTPRSFTASTMQCRIYRTLAGSTVFQYSLGVVDATAGNWYYGFPVKCTANDATVATQEIVYTQGERGGLSGILQNDIPPPARYIWAGSDRLILGRLDDPTAYQLSKLRFVGEPINWSNTPAFKGNVDAPVTGVAEMDGTWFIFTQDAIWSLTGIGPDDNGAGGSFDTPLRLPSDIGCTAAFSIVVTGQGLYFLGTTGRLYLMPRGGGAPQWVGQEVRDTLTSFPWITSSAYDEDSGRVYWACVDAAGATGRLVVLDTRINVFSVDNVQSRAIRSLSIFGGSLVIDGSIVETPGSFQDFDGSASATVLPTIVTGDIRPFGPLGYGRIKKSLVLGEARDVATAWSLTEDVSYDSGKTFSEAATWPAANLASAIGDAIDGAEHAFVLQRVDSVRLRWSWTTPAPTEGMVFNGFSLEVMPADGLKRQPPATRAA